MTAKAQSAGIWLAALLLAMLLGWLMTSTSSAGTDDIAWVEKCPVRNYELRIERPQRDVRIVSCVWMADVQEVTE